MNRMGIKSHSGVGYRIYISSSHDKPVMVCIGIPKIRILTDVEQTTEAMSGPDTASSVK